MAQASVVAATVIEELPRLLYRLRLDSQHEVTAHAGGQTERNFVRLVSGDRVEVELSPGDPGRGRILRKL